MAEKTKNDEELINILKIIAPGTLFREGLDNILKAKTGALIIIGDTKEVLDLVDGGFRIDEEYTPARLYELAKMDGAIVLSKDLKRILLANTQIIPSPKILTQETGTRHRTAERTAKQTGELVVSISQRRNIITDHGDGQKQQDPESCLHRVSSVNVQSVSRAAAPSVAQIVPSSVMKTASKSDEARQNSVARSSPMTNRAVESPSANVPLSARIVTERSPFCTGLPVCGSRM